MTEEGGRPEGSFVLPERRGEAWAEGARET